MSAVVGAELSELFHSRAPWAQLDPEGASGRVSGPAAYAEHEKRTGKTDPDGPDWCAEDLVCEQTGQEPPA